MAKVAAGHFTVLLKVLDLYELYNLVVARGGLVEVINKKQWQEIIKGLGLPSSITSAAFTLRTQYTKYLYPLECKTVNLSNPSDLQSAIEGNKREGRTSSYGPYGGMGHLPFQVCHHHVLMRAIIITIAELSTSSVVGGDASVFDDEHPATTSAHERQQTFPAPRYQRRYRLVTLQSLIGCPANPPPPSKPAHTITEGPLGPLTHSHTNSPGLQ